ncbi:hypothetical protein AAFC00_002490 [Neodothiora populina]|uniref:Uncharacterized protein n=1 Tax=Neodothiora populina TaxID=2781224 RepID=A0ABR3P796_9PEZI
MPPKRARTTAKSASTTTAPAAKATRSRTATRDTTRLTAEESENTTPRPQLRTSGTRNTRSRASNDLAIPASPEDASAVTARTTRTRRVVQPEENAVQIGTTRAEEAAPKDAPLRGARPGRRAKKMVKSQVDTAVLEALKQRMEADTRALEEGNAPATVPAKTQAGRSRQVEKDIAAAAEVEAAPALPPTNISPTTHAQSTAQRAPPSAQKAAPGTATRRESTLRVQSTPGADRSVLALPNFRRRPRQPSLLQMVQNPDLAREVGDDTSDFSLGASDDEDDFAPHDESTPLQVSKTNRAEVPVPPTTGRSSRSKSASRPSQSLQPQSPVINDDEDSLYGATPIQTPRSTRKRKSDVLEEQGGDHLPFAIQVPQSQAPPSHRASSPLSPALQSDALDDDLTERIPASAPEASQQSPHQSQLSSTYADPMSSSPPASPMSLSAASPRPLISPNTTRTTRDHPSAKPKPLTTATLRAMLPKRRIQRAAEADRSEYDIPSSSSLSELHSDESVFGHPRRRNNNTKPTKKSSTNVTSARNQRTGSGGGKPQGKKTYSRAAAITISSDATSSLSSSDKENTAAPNRPTTNTNPTYSSSLTELESEDNTPPDTSIETIKDNSNNKSRKGGSALLSGNLSDAKRFFQEVDEWEMEFESAPSLASGGAGSRGLGSSPAWR